MEKDSLIKTIPVSGTTYDLINSEQSPARRAHKKFVPRSLCRCGHSCHKPFCDGNHTNAEWLPTLKSRYSSTGRTACL